MFVFLHACMYVHLRSYLYVYVYVNGQTIQLDQYGITHNTYIYIHTHISYICCFGLGSEVSTVCMPSHRNILDLCADNTGLAATLRGLMQDVEVFIARIGFEVYHSISICGLQGPVY